VRPSILLSLALCACRIGFDDVDTTVEPEVGPTAKIRVTVLGSTEETTVGEPIADAYVVFVAGDSTIQTLRTPDDGVISADVLLGTDVHIARAAPELAANRWLLYSFHAIDSERELLVGGRPPISTAPFTMTANLPAFPVVDFTHSRVRGPMRCVPEIDDSSGTTVVFKFASACAGETVPLYAQGIENAPYIYMDLGATTLVDNGTLTPATAWLDADKYNVEYADLPASISEVYGFVALPGLTSSTGDAIIIDGRSETPDAGGATLYFDGPPLVAGAMIGTALFDGVNGTRLILERLDGDFGNRLFDNELVGAAVSIPIADGGARTLTWTTEQDPTTDVAGVQALVTTNGVEVTWRAYGPGASRAFAYPELPSALSSIVPDPSAQWSVDGIALVTLSDFTYATASALIDRDLEHWAGSAAYLPSGTVSISAAEAASPRTTGIPSLVSRIKHSLER